MWLQRWEHTAAVVRYFLTNGKAPEQGYKSCASLTKLGGALRSEAVRKCL